ncbi:DUF5915 domain-containing protein, partial [uncultured Corynebacterium sp.]
RGLQDARKNSGFDVSDRISVVLAVPEDKKEWAQRHAETIAGEVLATEFSVVTEPLAGAHDILTGVTATVAKN